MAFKKGISGNPGGRSGEKIFTDALRLELNRVDPQDKDKRKRIIESTSSPGSSSSARLRTSKPGRSSRSPIASKASPFK